ncbi:MAG: hypothetical protein KDA71_25380, partial [Planctomycetales bacterium]|nr:hypothetical protein [Planctomycetales bacterium]
LSGYIDTLGINKSDDRKDDGYLLRRAVLLRSLLERNDLVGINKACLLDEGLVRLLLTLSSLKHGARSLEQLLKMCVASEGQLRLPAIAQLEIHLNRKEAELLCSNVGRLL